jgi:hypothetical protein
VAVSIDGERPTSGPDFAGEDDRHRPGTAAGVGHDRSRLDTHGGPEILLHPTGGLGHQLIAGKLRLAQLMANSGTVITPLPGRELRRGGNAGTSRTGGERSASA